MLKYNDKITTNNLMNEFVRRPIISEFEDPVEYLREMLEYRRQAEPSFSVSRASQPLRRVSSTLVSLILRGRRRITLDRTDEFAQLMDLSSSEKFYFKNWIENKETHPSPHMKVRMVESTGNARM